MGFMFSEDWHAAYEDDPMLGDEPKDVEEAGAPATAMFDDADGAEPQMATPHVWNLATDAKASPSTVPPVSSGSQVTAHLAHLHILELDAPASLTDVSELRAFASANYQPPTGGTF